MYYPIYYHTHTQQKYTEQIFHLVNILKVTSCLKIGTFCVCINLKPNYNNFWYIWHNLSELSATKDEHNFQNHFILYLISSQKHTEIQSASN